MTKPLLFETDSKYETKKKLVKRRNEGPNMCVLEIYTLNTDRIKA